MATTLLQIDGHLFGQGNLDQGALAIYPFSGNASDFSIKGKKVNSTTTLDLFEFKVTSTTYSETDDLEAMVKAEFGEDYKIADWNDLVFYSTSNSIQDWADTVGMKNGDNYMVTYSGKHFYGSTRHYFIERHDHQVPNNWLVHDHIDNHFIDLGSWYNLNMPILCIKKKSQSELRIVTSFNSPTNYPSGIAYDGNNLWVCEYFGRKIYKISETGQILSSFSVSSSIKQPQGLSWDVTYLWVADYDGFGSSDMIHKISTTGDVLKSFSAPADEPMAVEHDSTNLCLWIADGAEIYKMDTNGNVLSSFHSTGSEPRGIAWDGEHLWICDFSDKKIYQVSTSGEIKKIYEAPGDGPAGLAWNGEYLWYVDFITDKIYKLQIPEVTSVSFLADIENVIPKKFVLEQNYPNPFNSSTEINFYLLESSYTTLKIYNILGKEIDTLLNRNLEPGKYTIKWNVRNLSSGVYFYRLETRNHSITMKCILQK